MVPDIWPGSNEGNPDLLTAVGNLLYFTAQDGFSGDAHGTELWRVAPPVRRRWQAISIPDRTSPSPET